MEIRPGGPEQSDWLLGLFDEAVAWMVARGQPGQWGSEPWSRRPAAVARVRDLCASGGLRVGALDGIDVAALIVGDRPAHVPTIDAPELYVELLLVSRRHAHRHLGEELVAAAFAEARARGVAVVRVDCWAGAPTLVAWYEARGFARAGTFAVGDWTGQVFAADPFAPPATSPGVDPDSGSAALASGPIQPRRRNHP